MPAKGLLFLVLVAAIIIGMSLPTPHAPKSHEAKSQFAVLETGGK